MLDTLNTLIAFVLIMTVVSLLITIVVQMISTVLNLRGRNLAKAMTQILQTTSPCVSADVKLAARQVTGYLLTRPHLSDHAFFNIFRAADGPPETVFAKDNYAFPWFRLSRFATAVRPQEVFDTLVELARPRTNETDTLAPAARKLLQQMGISLTDVDQTMATLERAQKAVIQLPGGPELAASLKKTQDTVVAAAGAAVNQAAAASTAAWGRFNFWFEATQDRAQQWFAMHTRFWTIICAFIFTFVCELDTIEIYRQVSTNKTLRDKLVASAEAFTSQAEKVLADTPSAMQDAFDVWRKRQTNAAVASLIGKIEPQPAETRGKFLERLGTTLAVQTNANALIADFSTVLDDTVQIRVTQQATQFARFSADLEQSGFPLFVKGGRWAKEKDANGQAPRVPAFFRHFWGMLMTAGLLTLGAPFWFNTLKSLTNLRSLVARDISKEEQGRANPTTTATTTAPVPTATPPPPPPGITRF